MNQAGIGFFAAVRDAARQKLGPAHPCTQALALASDGGDPATMAKAQDELGRLEPGELAELMAMPLTVASALMADCVRLICEAPPVAS